MITLSSITVHILVAVLNIISAIVVYLAAPNQLWLKRSLAVKPACLISLITAVIAICLWKPIMGLVPSIFASILCWVLCAFLLPYVTFLVKQWRVT